MVRRWFFFGLTLTLVGVGVGTYFWPPLAFSLIVIAPVAAVGLHDSFQRSHTILRNFPIIGHARYLMEELRPEVHQYFIESNTDAYPIDREMRELAYQRAKSELETKPFGSQRDFYQVGYEWGAHSLRQVVPLHEEPRVLIGSPGSAKAYSASRLNISAMSYGALSPNAVLALNKGASLGQFAHNTGEGGISEYHLENSGDLIWQIGTGYFGCRTKEGEFDRGMFAENASRESVRMIELKLSQGAKPGHGGVLPGIKVNAEIARIRGVPIGRTVLSPAWHMTFATPIGLLEFLQRLREESGGKPVGFKLAVGRTSEFFSICKAIATTGITPDFISVDGGEGGTGAAPLEFSNSVGMPAREAWGFVHAALVGVGVRDRIKILASGKILTGFDMIRAMALGADACYSARGMMLALGCIQALRCNSDHCPTGVATQNPALYKGLVVTDKGERVHRFHQGTVKAFLELLSAMGLENPADISPEMIHRRVEDSSIRTYAQLAPPIEPGQLLQDAVPPQYREAWAAASAERF